MLGINKRAGLFLASKIVHKKSFKASIWGQIVKKIFDFRNFKFLTEMKEK
jgi:hypothetical protein